MSLIKIAHGQVYDPANDIHGEVRDLWILDGKIVASPPQNRAPEKTIDATGMVVMPGGVDMHCHIAGPKVNSARKLRPDEKRGTRPVIQRDDFRSGTVGSVPSTFATGYLYAGMGYTSAFDAAVSPLAARHVHEEFRDTPILDKGFYVLLGNNQYALQQIADGEPQRLRSFVAWLMRSTGAYGTKIVNPGGVEVWKQSGGTCRSLDDRVGHFGATPRQILRELARTIDELGLPHPVHIHCNNLGIPGNWQTTLASMHALEGHRGHLTHIQFHSYGGQGDDQSTFCSKVPELADYVNSHPNLTVDVGQVMFGNTTSMTGDGPVGYYLHRLFPGKWVSADTELEAGCGIVPIVYQNKSLVHALQWAIGLEWYLLVNDPWRIAMSTDHPNGAAFLAYPEIIALLMDRSRREDFLRQLPATVSQHCTLPQLTREYTLSEIAIITRAGPARILGLTHKGHLGPGADGDITIYQPQSDLQKMFEMPRYVIGRGELIIDDCELRSTREGCLFHVEPDFDADCLPHLRDWFADHYTVQFENYPVPEDLLGQHRQVPCVSRS
ncbi:formylmethanofuran dehydrogenase subunit A [Planctomicrobium sp. SH664]|uniref:formylmethanofuran dehydrogenase subunit A n=1 Tax=Planctomicrobium sp. SH664 TaxID=3448125 RepID=UPI003F5AEC0F